MLMLILFAFSLGYAGATAWEWTGQPCQALIKTEEASWPLLIVMFAVVVGLLILAVAFDPVLPGMFKPPK